MKAHKDLVISIVVPVYNRPQEVTELLESLINQTNKDFEVIIIEDGSSVKCEQQVTDSKKFLDIKYFYKSNSGPGLSRNYGCEKAEGNYCIFLDSDCVLPNQYFDVVKRSLTNNYVDAFGGPDKADESFSNLQKAINYSMTSFFTTGGIRGGGEKLDKFYPRSFNMGLSKEVFDVTEGFSKMRFGEDIDLSIRILGNGFKTKLIRDAYVFHKRRTSLRQFFKQIYNSGIARINLYKKYSESLKFVHSLPSFFIIGVLLLLVLSVSVSAYFIFPIVLHIGLLFLDATIKNRSIVIGFLAVITSYVQLFAYGSGFLLAFWKRVVLRKEEYSAFKNTFYE